MKTRRYYNPYCLVNVSWLPARVRIKVNKEMFHISQVHMIQHLFWLSSNCQCMPMKFWLTHRFHNFPCCGYSFVYGGKGITLRSLRFMKKLILDAMKYVILWTFVLIPFSTATINSITVTCSWFCDSFCTFAFFGFHHHVIISNCRLPVFKALSCLC